MTTRLRNNERGAALMIVLMVMLLMSGLMIGFYAAIMSDQRSAGIDRDQTQVYSVAHAGLEKLTADLSNLFSTNFAPTGTQVDALEGYPPSMTGFAFVAPGSTTAGSGYSIEYNADASGNPAPEDPNGTYISAGPYEGFQGIITPYNIVVTARSNGVDSNNDGNPDYGSAEVRMKRTLQTIAVPVFQFGVFSENDLSFFAGPNFNFGGRIHTNENLYLAQGDGATLTLADRVTAVKDIIRTQLSNGWSTDTGSTYTGTVNAIKQTGVYRALGRLEGSLKADLTANEPTWTNLSVGTYNGNIRDGDTGARRLDLPLVSQGAKPVDIIRRPQKGENTSAPQVLDQRFYHQASLRILLSDSAADFTGLPDIVTATTPVQLDPTTSTTFGPTGKKAPLALSAGSGDYKSNNNQPLIGGVIKIEKQNSSGVWSDVTQEILDLGITGRNLSNGTADTPFTGSNGNSTTNGCLGSDPQPDAVIRLQRIKDRPSTHNTIAANLVYQYDCGVGTTGAMTTNVNDYWPLALYDPREALFRDTMTTSSTTLYLGGVMYYVELDVKNLARWFNGTIGSTGGQALKKTNGYIVYFSDRRNNRSGTQADCYYGATAALPCETAEYGYEDIVNATDSAGAQNGGTTPDAGEDFNGNLTLETYGGTARNLPAGASSPLDSSATPRTSSSLTSQVARSNRAILFRRALKLTNGGGTGLRSSGIKGLTIVSENPVYVQGDYNVGTAANYSTETHIACAVIADAVTMLSNAWNDIVSFTSPNDPGSRNASTTSYRFAVIAGKGLSFTKPTWTGAGKDFGTDGGAHNFLRYIEDWGGQTLNYRGSIVSFYTSRQATGTYKCCTNVYSPPTRGYNFDSEFLIPSKLPPGTPMFRDINTLTFRQLLRPNQ